MMLYGMEYPFGQFRPAVPAVPSPSAFPIPPHSLRGQRGKERESLDAVQALVSSSHNTSVSPVMF